MNRSYTSVEFSRRWSLCRSLQSGKELRRFRREESAREVREISTGHPVSGFQEWTMQSSAAHDNRCRPVCIHNQELSLCCRRSPMSFRNMVRYNTQAHQYLRGHRLSWWSLRKISAHRGSPPCAAVL